MAPCYAEAKPDDVYKMVVDSLKNGKQSNVLGVHVISGVVDPSVPVQGSGVSYGQIKKKQKNSNLANLPHNSFNYTSLLKSWHFRTIHLIENVIFLARPTSKPFKNTARPAATVSGVHCMCEDSVANRTFHLQTATSKRSCFGELAMRSANYFLMT